MLELDFSIFFSFGTASSISYTPAVVTILTVPSIQVPYPNVSLWAHGEVLQAFLFLLDS